MAESPSAASAADPAVQGGVELASDANQFCLQLHCGEGTLLREGFTAIITHTNLSNFSNVKALKVWVCREYNARKRGARVISDDFVLAASNPHDAGGAGWVVLREDHAPSEYVHVPREGGGDATHTHTHTDAPVRLGELLLAPKRSKKYVRLLLEKDSERDDQLETRDLLRSNSDATEKKVSSNEENSTWQPGDVIPADLAMLESLRKNVLQEALAPKPVLQRLDMSGGSRSSMLGVVERVMSESRGKSKVLVGPLSPLPRFEDSSPLTDSKDEDGLRMIDVGPDGLVGPRQSPSGHSTDSETASHTLAHAEGESEEKEEVNERHTLEFIFENVAEADLKAYMEKLPPSVLERLDNGVSDVAKQVVTHYKAWNCSEGIRLILRAVPLLLVLRGPNYPMVQKLLQMKSEMRSGKHVRFSLSALQAKRERGQNTRGRRRLRLRRSSATPYYDLVRPTMALSVGPEEMKDVVRRTSFIERSDFVSVLPFDPDAPVSLMDPTYIPHSSSSSFSSSSSKSFFNNRKCNKNQSVPTMQITVEGSDNPTLGHAKSLPLTTSDDVHPSVNAARTRAQTLTLPVNNKPVRRSILKEQPSSRRELKATDKGCTALYKIWAKEMEYGAAMLKIKNGLQTRRWFSVNSDLTTLRWRKCSHAEEKKQKKSFTFRGGRSRLLGNVRGMYYGTHYSTVFASYIAAGGKPWFCFTVEFTESEANMHIVCPDLENITRWFLGLQNLIHLTNTFVSRGTFLWQRTIMKFNQYGVDRIKEAIRTNTPLTE